MEKVDEWVRVYKYAKLKGQSRQNIYRWIREHKIPPENIKKEKITKEVILIKL